MSGANSRRPDQAGPTVFYSWQDELPKQRNRYFLQAAIRQALAIIAADGKVEAAPRLDEATLNVPGAPDIPATIFGKIDEAAAVVADVSIVNVGATGPDGIPVRATPNPNVLFEVGYAFKAIGHDRLILAMNDHYGAPEVLPFDLRPRRILRYTLSPDGGGRRAALRDLVPRLVEALRSVLSVVTVAIPAPLDLPWRDHLSRELGPPRHESVVTVLPLHRDGVAGDAVRLLEQSRRLGPHHTDPGWLQTIVYYYTGRGYTYIRARAIPISYPLYASDVTAHRLTGGHNRDLVVRWRDREGNRGLAVLYDFWANFRLAQWVPSDDPNISSSQFRPYLLEEEQVWGVDGVHRLMVRPVTQTTPTSLSTSREVEEEIVEESWMSNMSRAAGGWATLPRALIEAANLVGSTSPWWVLRRTWRWGIDPRGFTIASEELFAADELPPAPPWP